MKATNGSVRLSQKLKLGPVSIYWILVGPESTASSRIHGYKIHEFLLKQGWASTVLLSPLHWVFDVPLEPADVLKHLTLGREDVVIFQKVRGPRTVALLKALRELRVNTVYVDCDLPIKLNESALAALTICSSSQLADKYRQAGAQRVGYVPDAFEVSKCPSGRRGVRDQFQCIWFGFGHSSGTWSTVEQFRREIIDPLPRWSLTTVSDHPRADKEWSLATCWDAINCADAVALPSRDDAVCSVKSANRATQSMALGAPVLAFPVPSYAEIIRNRVNGFLCRDPAEWTTALHSLEDMTTWTRVSRCGYRFARRYFSIERIGAIWTQVLASFGQRRCEQEWGLEGRDQGITSLRSLYWARIADDLPIGSELRNNYVALASGKARQVL